MELTDDQALRRRLALGVQGACVATVALYALLRLVQARLFAEANPATVIWSAHAGYFWRVWTVAYAGCMCGYLTFAAAKEHETTVVRALLYGLYAAGALILVQGLLVP